MQFGMEVYLDNTKVDLEDQGHRSKVKVTRSKMYVFSGVLLVKLDVKGLIAGNWASRHRRHATAI